MTYPEPFGYLSGVRELTDGSILAADPVSQVLLRLSLDAGTADTIGREGAGPQEYDGPDQVFPLPADSTLLVDLGNGRLIVIDPAGTFVEWIPMNADNNRQFARTNHPSYVDGEGNMYVVAPAVSFGGPPDTVALHRIERATGDEAQVAFAWHGVSLPQRRGAKRRAFQLHDDFAVGQDGTVAVIRVNGYSVDWFFPTGRVVHGPPTKVETYPVRSADKEAEVEHIAASATVMYAEYGDEGVTNTHIQRGNSAIRQAGIEGFEWPQTLPVFRVGGAVISPNGEAWVQRVMPACGLGRMDIFDTTGARLGFIELPARSNVVGFSAHKEPELRVFVARTDDLGLLWLERHRVARIGR